MGKFDTLFGLDRTIINTVGKLKWIEYTLRYRSAFSSMKKLKDLERVSSNSSKTCYIIGLGPSLKHVDLNKIKGDTFVLNRFYRIGEKYPDFIPTYYVLSDEEFVLDKNIKDFEQCLNMYADKGTRYLLDSRFEDVPLVKGFNQDNFYYFMGFTGLFDSNKRYNIDKPHPIFLNVASHCIYFAIAMGYKKIVLLGCDFNSFATPMPLHCYDDNNNDKLRSLAMELYCYAFTAHVHYELAKYAKKHEAKIENSTKGSLIDAYPIVIDESLYVK